MIRRLALFAGVVAVAVPALMVVATAPAGATFEFSFVSHSTNFEAVIGGHATTDPQSQPGPGDSFVIRDDLLRGSTVIGFDNIVCTVTFNDNTMCNAVFAFTGKGDLMGTALLRGGAGQSGPSVFDGAITGGTFAYRNAHGDVHITTLPNGDSENHVNFVTR